jgi:histidine triad (HIT) family protein
MVDGCIFCRILAGDAPASFVHRGQAVSSLIDIRPVTPGHLLVIPNRHVTHVRDLPDAVADELFAVARRLARALLRTGLRAEGTNMLVADGEQAGQEVFHAHLHVFPRFAGDGFRIGSSAYDEAPPSRTELDGVAEQIVAAMAGEREVGS